MTKITLSVTEAKNRLSALIRQIADGGEITITKRDRPCAVIVSWRDYRCLQRQAAAGQLRNLRDALHGSGLDAQKIYRHSRAQLNLRS